MKSVLVHVGKVPLSLHPGSWIEVQVFTCLNLSESLTTYHCEAMAHSFPQATIAIFHLKTDSLQGQPLGA